MHLSLLGVYWYPFARGFYVGKIGDERFDSSLVGVHWSVEVEDDELYSVLSFDIAYITLIRNTFRSIFKSKSTED